jgi:Uma2 family endonuclease
MSKVVVGSGGGGGGGGGGGAVEESEQARATPPRRIARHLIAGETLEPRPAGGPTDRRDRDIIQLLSAANRVTVRVAAAFYNMTATGDRNLTSNPNPLPGTPDPCRTRFESERDAARTYYKMLSGTG